MTGAQENDRSGAAIEHAGQNLRLVGIMCVLTAIAVMLSYISVEMGMDLESRRLVAFMIVLGLTAYVIGMFNQYIPEWVRDLVGGADD